MRLFLLGGLILITTAGCTPQKIYPVVQGSHALLPSIPLDKRFKFVVWANHPTATTVLTILLQSEGHIVVERAQLERVFSEQHTRLAHAPDSDSDILKVGHLLGADRVVFADVSIGYYPRKAQVGVTVRSIVVETGEIHWMGVAYYPVPIKDQQAAIHQATEYAFARATCRVEQGHRWIPPQTDPNKPEGGCVK